MMRPHKEDETWNDRRNCCVISGVCAWMAKINIRTRFYTQINCKGNTALKINITRCKDRWLESRTVAIGTTLKQLMNSGYIMKNF